MSERITIIDFIEKYTEQFASMTYLREKMDGEWKEITFAQTRERVHRIGAGLMSLGVAKGDKVALLSESRSMWMLAEMRISEGWSSSRSNAVSSKIMTFLTSGHSGSILRILGS